MVASCMAWGLGLQAVAQQKKNAGGWTAQRRHLSISAHLKAQHMPGLFSGYLVRSRVSSPNQDFSRFKSVHRLGLLCDGRAAADGRIERGSEP
jgi:hypothetical protein